MELEVGAASQCESQALWQGRREALGPYADLFAREGASHAELAACDALLHRSGAPPLPPSVRSIMAECNGFGLPGFGALSFSPSVTLLPVSSLPHGGLSVKLNPSMPAALQLSCLPPVCLLVLKRGNHPKISRMPGALHLPSTISLPTLRRGYGTYLRTSASCLRAAARPVW